MLNACLNGARPGDAHVAIPLTPAQLAREAVDELNGVAMHVPRLVHGHDSTTWAVVDRAADLGYDTRIGLEDSLLGPDGRVVTGNAELVAAVRQRIG